MIEVTQPHPDYVRRLTTQAHRYRTLKALLALSALSDYHENATGGVELTHWRGDRGYGIDDQSLDEFLDEMALRMEGAMSTPTRAGE